MIDPYEKILMVMRNQGRTDSPMFTGLLNTDGTCEVGDIILESGDYAKLGNITVSQKTEVLIANVDDRLIILGKVVE